MEDDTGGSRKRGIFLDTNQEPAAKIARFVEYRSAFQAFDSNRSGFIELAELSNALQAVLEAVEATTPRKLGRRPFHVATSCWLCARFGGGLRLDEGQFCELLAYVQNLRSIFEQVDTDRSGSIECGELHRAFQFSGVNLDTHLVNQVGQSFDADESGTLEFDEFVQLRLEWDYYVSAWDQATSGSSVIAPDQLLKILEEIKRSLEPVGAALVAQAAVPMANSQGLFYSSMFNVCRPFQAQTCERLIIRFGEGNLYLSFGQFCTMLVFLKEMKRAFCRLDSNGSGSLNYTELSNAFAGAGMQLPQEIIVKIGQSVDRDNSGEIEFDEFLQLAVEWYEMRKEQAQFSAQASGRVGPAMLQELFGHVRVLYRVVNGAIPTLRPFSLNTCRWLVAKFGSPQAGEVFAQSVGWTEFLNLIQYLRESYVRFLECDFFKTGTISAQELGLAMAAYGLRLSPEAVDNIRRCYDMDSSGRFEFDEFLQLLVECQLYDKCFDARLAQTAILTPLNTLSPLLGPAPPPLAAPGFVTLDKSAFFCMVFAVPRNLSQ